MAIYPLEFHRRLEQKWASRIDQIVTGNGTPPRDPNGDDDEEEDDEEEEEDEKRNDQPPVVREPEPDE